MWSTSDSTSDRWRPERAHSACWLVRDGKVLASLEVPDGRKARARGLLGRDRFEGAMLLHPVRSVHTVRMQFDIDMALIDPSGVVVKTMRVNRNRVTAPRLRVKTVIEAEAGAFNMWGLKIGDELEIRESR